MNYTYEPVYFHVSINYTGKFTLTPVETLLVAPPAMKVDKKALFSLKFNSYTCRHVRRDVRTTYYPSPNPDHKRVLNVCAETLTLTPKL